jgi:hypothetical protein
MFATKSIFYFFEISLGDNKAVVNQYASFYLAK